MVKFYYLKSEIKLVPEHNLYIKNCTIKNLRPSSANIFGHLKYRPLFHKELTQLLTSEKELLNSFDIDFKSKEKIKALFDSSLKLNATHLKFQVKTKARLVWKENEFEIKPGLYVIPRPFPNSITGASSKSWLKIYDPCKARDRWIIDSLKLLRTTDVLELGCGTEKRLNRLIKKVFPTMQYLGIDLKPPEEENFVIGNFTESLPKMQNRFVAVAEESIEHVPKKSILPLLELLRSHGSTALVATTPNRDYNHFLGVRLRRSDHQFEWTSADLNKWTKEVQAEGFRVIRFKIGKRIKGIAPTWGLIIHL